MGTVVTIDQLTRTQDVLVRELATLRNHALARHVDAAHVNQVFRRRADRLSREFPWTCRDDADTSDPTPVRSDMDGSDEGEYSVWW